MKAPIYDQVEVKITMKMEASDRLKASSVNRLKGSETRAPLSLKTPHINPVNANFHPPLNKSVQTSRW